MSTESGKEFDAENCLPLTFAERTIISDAIDLWMEKEIFASQNS